MHLAPYNNYKKNQLVLFDYPRKKKNIIKWVIRRQAAIYVSTVHKNKRNARMLTKNVCACPNKPLNAKEDLWSISKGGLQSTANVIIQSLFHCRICWLVNRLFVSSYNYYRLFLSGEKGKQSRH